METYTVIEDVFGDEEKNQLTAARGFLGNNHVPDDLRAQNYGNGGRNGGGGRVGRVNERPDLPPDVYAGRRMNSDVGGGGRFQEEQIQVPQLVMPQTDLMMGPTTLHCRDVFNHVENCSLCSSYFRRDTKFYWLIIIILVIIILLLTRNSK